MSEDTFTEETIQAAYHRLGDDTQAIDAHAALIQFRRSGRSTDRRAERARRGWVGVLVGVSAIIVGVVGWTSLNRSTAVTVDQSTTVPVAVDEAPASKPSPGASLDEVARTSDIEGVALSDFASDGTGGLWVAAGCGQTLKYDATMTQTLGFSDPDGDMCSIERVEIDGQGTLYAIDSVPGPDTDGHGEAEPVPILVRVAPNGDDEVVRVFDDATSGLASFEIDGADAITAFGPHVFVVDVETGDLRASAELDSPVVALTSTADAVWVATNSEVLALDRTRLVVVEQAKIGRVRQLVASDGDIWGLVDGAVVAISNPELPTPPSNDDFVGQRASDGRIWLATRNELVVFAASEGSELARIELAPNFTPGVLEVDGPTAWLESALTQQIVRYELNQ